MAFKIEGKEMNPIFVFTKCCWSVHSYVVKLGNHAHSKKRRTIPHKLCSFTSSLCACPASSASIECIFSIYYLVWSKIRKFICREGRKKWLKYTEWSELKKITIRIYSYCSIYSSLFFMSFQFRCCSFCLIE